MWLCARGGRGVRQPRMDAALRRSRPLVLSLSLSLPISFLPDRAVLSPLFTRFQRLSRRLLPPLPGLAPEIPEDLYCLIKKAVSVRKHLDKFRGDTDAKFRLILIESRIHRLSRYYKTVKALPPNWKYESATASTMVS